MTTPLLTPSDLQAYMQAQGIPGKILLLETPTPTVEIAAQVVSAQPDQIIKSILFTVDEEPVLAIACLALIHISEPTRLLSISYAVFCLKKKNRLTS